MISRQITLASAIAGVTLAISACATTGDGIQAGNYQCNELKQLVAEQQQAKLTGFLGSLQVYASADSCDPILEKPSLSAWKTSDVFSCVVGYRCDEIIGKEATSQ